MMVIQPKEKGFYILPLFKISKYINPLSKDAKVTFNSEWNYYITLSIGWGFWSFSCCIINK